MVGKSERGPARELMEEYMKRLERLASIESVIVPEASHGDASVQRKVENERLIAALRPGERVIALDERGKEFTSPQFAGHLSAWRDQGVKHAAFLVGGAYGLNDDVRDRAELVMALSQMTFTHQFVRAVLAEQLYRAYAIMNRLPYHH